MIIILIFIIVILLRIDDNDFSFDLGGDFGKMIFGSDKCLSVVMVKDE